MKSRWLDFFNPYSFGQAKFSWSHKSVACSKLFFELSRVPTRWCIIIYHHMHICTNKRFSTQIICVANSYLSKMQFAKIQTVASKKSPFWNSCTHWRIYGFSKCLRHFLTSHTLTKSLIYLLNFSFIF